MSTGSKSIANAGAPSQPPESKETEVSPLDDALVALPGELRQNLAKLCGTPDEEAEGIIGLFPYGHRTLLESYKLITTSLARSARRPENEEENPRLQVHLTDLGREIIDSCAASRDEEIEDLVQRAKDLHSRFSDSLEPEANGEVSEEATA